MPNPTTNYGWTKPTVGGSANAWGTILNDLLDEVDADLDGVADAAAAAQTDADSALTLAGQVLGKRMNLHWSALSARPGTVSANGNYYQAAGSEVTDIPVQLPDNATITALGLTSDRNGGLATGVALYRADYLTGAATLIASTGRSAAGIGADEATGLSEVVDNNTSYYYLRATLFSPNRMYGCYLQYNAPDARSTL
jgi:hypothetical protein